MKKFLFGFILILSLMPNFTFGQAAAKTTAVAAPAVAKPEYRIPFVNRKLDNGLEVIVYPDAAVPIVTVELDVRNGSFTEPPELNGLSHLFEHMFFKPNKATLLAQCDAARALGRTNDRCNEVFGLRPRLGDVGYLQNIGQMGITYNGSTREEVVNYYYTTTRSYVESALRVINDSVRYPLFDEEDFRKEKEVVIGEIDRNESNPFFYLNRTLMEKMFSKYPTRKNPLGTRESIATATTEKMRTIQGRYYVPNNSALVVTGDVDPETVFKLAKQYFGDWQARPVDPFKEFPLVEHPPLTKSDGFIVEQPVQNVLIQIGWHGPSIGKDNAATYAADVFSFIVTQPDSRFQRNLVDSGLAAGVEIGYYTQRNVGPVVVTLVTSPDKAKAALKAVYAEIAQFDKPTAYTDAELQNAKTILESRDLFEREKLSEYAHTLGFWWSSTGIEYFSGYHQNLRAITREDTDRYIRTYVQNKPHIGVALLSKESQAIAGLTPADLTGN
ncbi:MAG: M16 family metallopeptidase [Pyrinomonadaceae bacterium]